MKYSSSSFAVGTGIFQRPVITALFFSFLLFAGASCVSQNKISGGASSREFVAIRVYHATDAGQLQTVQQYLQASLLPKMESSGYRKIGVFTAIDNDTAADKRLFVFIPFSSLAQLQNMTAIQGSSLLDSTVAPAYTKAAYNSAPFTRFETILLQEFEGMPIVKPSGVSGPMADRVYELRSYESATEALHRNKVQMFNSGEVDLFQRLGFNAVFYGQVLAGSKMPNLMYMTSFENKAARDEHWKAFGNDPQWKSMAANPIYQNNVSHIDITFLRPVSFSKL